MKKFALLAIAGLLNAEGVAFAGDVTGTITLKGTPPAEMPIQFDDTCGALHPTVTTTRHYVVGKDNGLANVFVYISKGMEGKSFPAPAAAKEINQEGCMYHPYVTGVMVGQVLKFKSSDPILHNVHALPKTNQEFNYPESKVGAKITRVFTAPECPVRFKCDVLWSQLDALHYAYVTPGLVPPGAFRPDST